MNVPMKNLWIIGLVIGVWSCKTSVVTSPTLDPATFSGYQEELSARLPDFPDYLEVVQKAQPKIQPSIEQVDALLEKKIKANYEKAKTEPYFTGFTVLVYSGIDRNEAFKVKEELVTMYPELIPELQYQQPRYLVKVGTFGFKIEAQPIYYKLKPQFPATRIIQDRFLREEYTISTDSNAKEPN